MGAAKSFKPRSIVLRANPVARATALTPPYPAERASAAANNDAPVRPTHPHRVEAGANRSYINHAADISSADKMGNPHPRSELGSP